MFNITSSLTQNSRENQETWRLKNRLAPHAKERRSPAEALNVQCLSDDVRSEGRCARRVFRVAHATLLIIGLLAFVPPAQSAEDVTYTCDVCDCDIEFRGACCQGQCDQVFYFTRTHTSVDAYTFSSGCFPPEDMFG